MLLNIIVSLILLVAMHMLLFVRLYLLSLETLNLLNQCMTPIKEATSVKMHSLTLHTHPVAPKHMHCYDNESDRNG